MSEVWQAEVTPFSASEVGDSVASNTLTIGDPTPWVSGVTLTATSPGSITTDDLICEYQLEGSAITVAVAWYKDAAPLINLYLPMEGGSTNALLDLSGNSHTVTAMGDPTWQPTGGYDGNGAFDFDGNDYLNAGESFPTLSSYTKVARVYMTGSGSNNIISSQDGTGGHAFFASVSQGFRLTAGHSGNWYFVQDPDPLLYDTWYFVATTFDYTSGEIILYKDDAEVARDTVPPAQRDVTDATTLVGALVNGACWNGLIDDARVYDYVLSPEQLLALYHGPDTIKSTETSVGEQWYADVTPFSTTEMGITISSNTLQINADSLKPPTLLEPPDTSIVYDTIPTFSWTIAYSPYPDKTTYYDLYISTDSNFFLWVTKIDSLISPGYTWELEQLDFGTMYWCKVVAWVDLDTAIVTAPSEKMSFWTWTLGDVDLSHDVNVADLTRLVGFLFKGGEPLDPPYIGDLDGNCEVNVADLTYLVKYLFKGGPPPEIGCE